MVAKAIASKYHCVNIVQYSVWATSMCAYCSKFRIPKLQPRMKKLHARRSSEQPWKQCSIDLKGPLVESCGFRYVGLLLDSCSNFLVAFRLKGKTAQVCICECVCLRLVFNDVVVVCSLL
jgi:hypothetical protein